MRSHGKLQRIQDAQARLTSLRQESAVLGEQVAAFQEMADDLRLRQLVAETPLSEREYSEARRHADAAQAAMDRLREEATELEGSINKMLLELEVV